jgi:hypothetical protein
LLPDFARAAKPSDIVSFVYSLSAAFKALRFEIHNAKGSFKGELAIFGSFSNSIEFLSVSPSLQLEPITLHNITSVLSCFGELHHEQSDLPISVILLIRQLIEKFSCL